MKKKTKALIAMIILLLLTFGAFLAFYFTRPLIVMVTENVSPEWIKRLSSPDALTLGWRTKKIPVDEWKGEGDIILDLSIDGIADSAGVIRIPTEASVLFPHIFDELASNELCYIYDGMDEDQVELLGIMSEIFPDMETISWEYELSRSRWEVERKKISPETVLVVPDLYPALGFIRSLGDVRLAVDFLDAAALETIEAEFVAEPDWPSLIEEAHQ